MQWNYNRCAHTHTRTHLIAARVLAAVLLDGVGQAWVGGVRGIHDGQVLVAGADVGLVKVVVWRGKGEREVDGRAVEALRAPVASLDQLVFAGLARDLL